MSSSFPEEPNRTNTSSPSVTAPSHHASPHFGPDGITPFGFVPRKIAGVGLTEYIMDTYRHIEAEHQAGYRMRGVFERTLNGWRRKAGCEKMQKGDGQRVKGRKRRTEKILAEHSSSIRPPEAPNDEYAQTPATHEHGAGSPQLDLSEQVASPPLQEKFTTLLDLVIFTELQNPILAQHWPIPSPH